MYVIPLVHVCSSLNLLRSEPCILPDVVSVHRAECKARSGEGLGTLPYTVYGLGGVISSPGALCHGCPRVLLHICDA